MTCELQPYIALHTNGHVFSRESKENRSNFIRIKANYEFTDLKGSNVVFFIFFLVIKANSLVYVRSSFFISTDSTMYGVISSLE